VIVTTEIRERESVNNVGRYYEILTTEIIIIIIIIIYLFEKLTIQFHGLKGASGLSLSIRSGGSAESTDPRSTMQCNVIDGGT